MSLDIYLESGIKIKKVCPHCDSEYETEEDYLYHTNITHNLGAMANEAGIYKHLWRPEEINITTAKGLIIPLQEAIKDMKKRPEHYKKFNPSNRWGSYESFVPWLEKLLNACAEYPEAKLRISR